MIGQFVLSIVICWLTYAHALVCGYEVDMHIYAYALIVFSYIDARRSCSEARMWYVLGKRKTCIDVSPLSVGEACLYSHRAQPSKSVAIQFERCKQSLGA